VFTRGELRPGMDVYTRDHVYLGTVLAVLPGPEPLPAPAPPAAPTDSFHGEALGPAPTEALGNSGPRAQCAATNYATAVPPTDALGLGALVVGRWWGLVARRVIPFDDIQTVSLERVVLCRAASEL
jgi:hypothetical protein